MSSFLSLYLLAWEKREQGIDNRKWGPPLNGGAGERRAVAEGDGCLLISASLLGLRWETKKAWSS